MTKFIPKTIMRFLQEAPTAQETPLASNIGTIQKTSENAKIAAIMGAIEYHREQEKNEDKAKIAAILAVMQHHHRVSSAPHATTSNAKVAAALAAIHYHRQTHPES